MRMNRSRSAITLAWLAALPLATGPVVAAYGADLTPLEERGKQVYVEGTSPSGNPIEALVGVEGFPLPASSMPCASCHGRDGRGRPEGGVIPSDITWGHLTTRYGHEHSYGREHPAYDAASVALAISERIDPAGNALDVAMPAYRMEEEDLDALVAYLQRIETDYDPGITPESVTLATLLPLSGRMAGLGNAMRAVMDAYVDELNAAGGINGRVVELDVIPFADSPDGPLANLEAAVAESGTFALLSPYSVGIEAELARFAETAQLPVIAPYSLRPPSNIALDQYTFYLFAGDGQLMRVLVEAVADANAGTDPGVTLLGPDLEDVHTLVKAVTSQARRRSWQDPATLYYEPDAFDANALAGQLRDMGVLFFFGSAEELETLLAALAEADSVPLVAVPASRVTRSLFDAPAAFDGRILSAYPRSPSDVTDSGRQAYLALRAEHELAGDHASAQLAVLAAAETFAEAAMRAGRHLSRESLVRALETLREFETGLTPALTFSLNRRVGALGGYVVRVDLDEGTFVAEGPWRALP